MKYSLILLASAVALSSCGKSDTKTVTIADGKGGSATVESSESTTKITGDNGEKMTITNGGDASSLPAFVPLYPGAKLGESATINTDGVKVTTATFTTPDSGEKILAFYKPKLEAANLKIAMEMNSGDESMLMASSTGQLKEKETSVSVSVEKQTDGSEIALIVSIPAK